MAIIAQKMDGGGTQRGGEKAFFESSIICSSYILEKISFQRRHIHWLAIPWLCVRVCALERQERERDRESLYLYVCQYMYIHIFVYFDMYIYINVQCICFIRIYTRESNHVSRLHVLYVCMYTYVWLRSVGSIK